MKLNLEIIQDHLPERFHSQCAGQYDKGLSLGRPLIYEPGSILESGKLYITRVQSLPKTPSVTGAAFICDGGRISQEWAVSGNQFLLLSNCSGLLQLLNMVQEIYDRFDTLDNAIVGEFAKGQDFDIGRIVKYGSEMLGNPLSVTDSTLNIVLNTKVLYKNGVIIYDVDNSKTSLNLETYTLLKDACLLERELRKPYISNVQHNGFRGYCYNLYYLDVFIGCAWFSEINRKFRNSDFQLADHIFKYLQQAVISNPHNTNQVSSNGKNALCSLLEHDTLSAGAYEQFQLQPEESWMFFRLKELEDRKAMPKDYMLVSLNVLMNSAVHTIIFNNDIIGLLRLRNNGDICNNESFILLRSILQRMDYVCGVSNEFSDIAQLDNAYLEAGFALDQLFKEDVRQILGFFRDRPLEYMLSRVNGELPLSELYSKELLRLYEYDRRHNSNYLKTLNVYLKTEMNATQTAKMLFIHRSSFLKRLEKITKLLGTDLEDPKKRMYYRLIFSAWEAGYGDETIGGII